MADPRARLVRRVVKASEAPIWATPDSAASALPQLYTDDDARPYYDAIGRALTKRKPRTTRMAPFDLSDAPSHPPPAGRIDHLHPQPYRPITPRRPATDYTGRLFDGTSVPTLITTETEAGGLSAQVAAVAARRGAEPTPTYFTNDPAVELFVEWATTDIPTRANPPGTPARPDRALPRTGLPEPDPQELDLGALELEWRAIAQPPRPPATPPHVDPLPGWQIDASWRLTFRPPRPKARPPHRPPPLPIFLENAG